MQKHGVFSRVDDKVTAVLKLISYPAGGALIFMAFLATANVIYSKIAKTSIPSSTDWIAYMMIPAVYLCVGYMILDRGLIAVDFLNKRFPKWLNEIILIVSHIVGIVVNVMVGINVMNQVGTYFAMNKTSSSQALAVPLWPFYLIFGVGIFLLSAALFWGIIRTLLTGSAVKEQGNVDEKMDREVTK